jgi:hypothetical protein
MLDRRARNCQFGTNMLGLTHAPVAQLDRAAASEAVGQKFESSRAHHFLLTYAALSKAPLCGSEAVYLLFQRHAYNGFITPMAS